MPDSKNNLYLYEALELRAEYDARIETLKGLLPEARENHSFFRTSDEGRVKPAASFSVEEVHDELDRLAAKKRKLNNAIQGANFENQVFINGESMNLAEALELRKAVNEQIAALSNQLKASAYLQVIYKEDRDIVEGSEDDYPKVKEALQEKRVLFRELNRKLRASSFTLALDFKDE